MLFAAEYPFLDGPWTTVIIVAGFIWLMLLFYAAAQIEQGKRPLDGGVITLAQFGALKAKALV
jgi:hypothetical protein